jgi:hypothetical protein
LFFLILLGFENGKLFLIKPFSINFTLHWGFLLDISVD